MFVTLLLAVCVGVINCQIDLDRPIDDIDASSKLLHSAVGGSVKLSNAAASRLPDRVVLFEDSREQLRERERNLAREKRREKIGSRDRETDWEREREREIAASRRNNKLSNREIERDITREREREREVTLQRERDRNLRSGDVSQNTFVSRRGEVDNNSEGRLRNNLASRRRPSLSSIELEQQREKDRQKEIDREVQKAELKKYDLLSHPGSFVSNSASIQVDRFGHGGYDRLIEAERERDRVIEAERERDRERDVARQRRGNTDRQREIDRAQRGGRPNNGKYHEETTKAKPPILIYEEVTRYIDRDQETVDGRPVWLGSDRRPTNDRHPTHGSFDVHLEHIQDTRAPDRPVSFASPIPGMDRRPHRYADDASKYSEFYVDDFGPNGPDPFAHEVHHVGTVQHGVIPGVSPHHHIAEVAHAQAAIKQQQLGQAIYASQAIQANKFKQAALAAQLAALQAGKVQQAAAHLQLLKAGQAQVAAGSVNTAIKSDLRNKLKIHLKNQLKHKVASAVSGIGQQGAAQQHSADLAVAVTHLTDPHDTHLHHHLAEVKHHLHRAREELFRRLSLLKPYFKTGGSSGYAMPNRLPDLPTGIQLTSVQVDALPKIPIQVPANIPPPSIHIPELQGVLKPPLDPEYIEYVLNLPDNIFTAITQMTKREFIVTLFPTLYRDSVRDITPDVTYTDDHHAPIEHPSSSYGVPIYPPLTTPSSGYGPPKSSSTIYSPPKQITPSYSPPKQITPSYNPPKITSTYNPPKITTTYNPPKQITPSYNPPKITTSYNPPKITTIYNPPKITTSYNPPKITTTYSPPTSYDLPKPPSTSYGAPHGHHSKGTPKVPVVIHEPSSFVFPTKHAPFFTTTPAPFFPTTPAPYFPTTPAPYFPTTPAPFLTTTSRLPIPTTSSYAELSYPGDNGSSHFGQYQVAPGSSTVLHHPTVVHTGTVHADPHLQIHHHEHVPVTSSPFVPSPIEIKVNEADFRPGPIHLTISEPVHGPGSIHVTTSQPQYHSQSSQAVPGSIFFTTPFPPVVSEVTHIVNSKPHLGSHHITTIKPPIGSILPDPITFHVSQFSPVTVSTTPRTTSTVVVGVDLRPHGSDQEFFSPISTTIFPPFTSIAPLFPSTTFAPTFTTFAPTITASTISPGIPITTHSQPIPTTTYSPPVSSTYSVPLIPTTSRPFQTTSRPFQTTSRPFQTTSRPFQTTSHPFQTTPRPTFTSTIHPILTTPRPTFAPTQRPIVTTLSPVFTTTLLPVPRPTFFSTAGPFPTTSASYIPPTSRPFPSTPRPTFTSTIFTTTQRPIPQPTFATTPRPTFTSITHPFPTSTRPTFTTTFGPVLTTPRPTFTNTLRPGITTRPSTFSQGTTPVFSVTEIPATTLSSSIFELRPTLVGNGQFLPERQPRPFGSFPTYPTNSDVSDDVILINSDGSVVSGPGGIDLPLQKVTTFDAGRLFDRIPGTDANDDRHILTPFSQRKGNATGHQQSQTETGIGSIPGVHRGSKDFIANPGEGSGGGSGWRPSHPHAQGNRVPPSTHRPRVPRPPSRFGQIDTLGDNKLPMPQLVGGDGLPIQSVPNRIPGTQGIEGLAIHNSNYGVADPPRPITAEDLAKLPPYLRDAPTCATVPTNRSFCLMPQDYPSELAASLSKEYGSEIKEILDLLSTLPSPSVDLSQASSQLPNIDPSVECQSERRTVELSWSRDVLGSWFVILQTPPFRQPVTVTTCSPSARAKGCRPLLQPRPLVALQPRDPQPRPFVFDFPLPVACVFADSLQRASSSTVTVIVTPDDQPVTSTSLDNDLDGELPVTSHVAIHNINGGKMTSRDDKSVLGSSLTRESPRDQLISLIPITSFGDKPTPHSPVTSVKDRLIPLIHVTSVEDWPIPLNSETPLEDQLIKLTAVTSAKDQPVPLNPIMIPSFPRSLFPLHPDTLPQDPTDDVRADINTVEDESEVTHKSGDAHACYPHCLLTFLLLFVLLIQR